RTCSPVHLLVRQFGQDPGVARLPLGAPATKPPAAQLRQLAGHQLRPLVQPGPVLLHHGGGVTVLAHAVRVGEHVAVEPPPSLEHRAADVHHVRELRVALAAVEVHHRGGGGRRGLVANWRLLGRGRARRGGGLRLGLDGEQVHLPPAVHLAGVAAGGHHATSSGSPVTASTRADTMTSATGGVTALPYFRTLSRLDPVTMYVSGNAIAAPISCGSNMRNRTSPRSTLSRTSASDQRSRVVTVPTGSSTRRAVPLP